MCRNFRPSFRDSQFGEVVSALSEFEATVFSKLDKCDLIWRRALIDFSFLDFRSLASHRAVVVWIVFIVIELLLVCPYAAMIETHCCHELSHQLRH